MDTFEKISAYSVSGMRVQAHRIQIVSENIANVDTHGYRRKLLTFENVHNQATQMATVEIGQMFLDPKPGEEIFDPSHPFANGEGYVVMSNVNMMTEFADAREANRSYEAGLQIFRQARDMYTSLLGVLRT